MRELVDKVKSYLDYFHIAGTDVRITNYGSSNVYLKNKNVEFTVITYYDCVKINIFLELRNKYGDEEFRYDVIIKDEEEIEVLMKGIIEADNLGLKEFGKKYEKMQDNMKIRWR